MSRKIAVVGLLLVAGALLLIWRIWPGDGDGGSGGNASLSSVEAGAPPTSHPAQGVKHRSARALSSVTGRGGIHGVVQRLSDGRGLGGVELVWLDAARDPVEERARVQSAPSGHFSLALAAGSYRLRVNAPGHHLAREAWPLVVMSEARTDAWVVGVQQMSVLRGQVVDTEGHSLAKVRVGLAGVRRGGRWVKRPPGRDAVESAVDGSFALKVPAGALRLALFSGERWILSPTLLIPAGSKVSGLRLVARADASLTGQVVGPGGARIGNAMVVFDDILGQREIRCDEDGRFKVGDLSAGELLLMPRAAGMAARSLSRVNLRMGGKGRVVLQMEPTQRQVGRVVGDDGRGVGGARIEAQPMTPTRIARRLIESPPLRSAADGRFVLQLDTRPRTIIASAPGPLRAYRKGFVPRAGDLILPLRPVGEIAGKITSSGGKPLGFVRLTIEDGGRRRSLWLITGKGGRFRLPGLMPGTVTLDVEADSYASKRVAFAVRSGVTTPLELRLTAPGSIAGSVRNADHSVLMGAEVRVEGQPARAFSDFHGRFVLKGLAEGLHILRVMHVDRRTQRVEKVRVTAGGMASLPVITLQLVSARAPEIWRPSKVQALSQKGD